MGYPNCNMKYIVRITQKSNKNTCTCTKIIEIFQSDEMQFVSKYIPNFGGWKVKTDGLDHSGSHDQLTYQGDLLAACIV